MINYILDLSCTLIFTMVWMKSIMIILMITLIFNYPSYTRLVLPKNVIKPIHIFKDDLINREVGLTFEYMTPLAIIRAVS